VSDTPRARMGHTAHTSSSFPDDDARWMALFDALDDRQVDALLSGAAPDDPDLAPVADVAQALRRTTAGERVPPMSPALRAQLASPPVASIENHRAIRAALLKAVAAAAAAAVALVGVGAAQNRLPTEIQDVVSSTADLVGIDVPRSEERHGPDGSSSDGAGANGDAVPPNGEEGEADGTPGHDGLTPSGTDPADPGTPGDQERATPATPPAPGGDGDEQPANDGDPSTNNAGPNGLANGTGAAGSNGNGTTTSNPNGQVNGSGSAKRSG
jgi:hypothetical protein